MRKFAFVLVLALLVSVLVSATAVSPADMLGTWYLGYFDYDSHQASIIEEYKVELNRDKTAVLVLGGEEQQTTWELTDSGAEVVIGDSSTSFYMQEDGSLKAYVAIGAEGNKYDCFFFREQPKPVEIPEKADVADEDEYFGTYALTLQTKGNMLIPFENGEEILKITIEFAQITVSGSSVYEGSQMSDFKDGKLIIPAKDLVYSAEGNLFIEKTGTGIMATCEGIPDTVYYLSPVGDPEVKE
ncbi:MAG: hypothetical protein IJI09_04220 [Clostridia bacterium]|nr:hypothetical protein [Clostridia bacterium]